MTYREWVQKHGHSDHLVKDGLPDANEVGDATFRELIEKFGHTIKQTGEELGIELTEDDLIEILDRIYGVPDLPKFTREDYDRHC